MAYTSWPDRFVRPVAKIVQPKILASNFAAEAVRAEVTVGPSALDTCPLETQPLVQWTTWRWFTGPVRQTREVSESLHARSAGPDFDADDRLTRP